MKKWLFMFAPLELLLVDIGIWLVAFLFYNKVSLNIIIVSCSIGQLIIFFFCGLIIQKLHQQANIDSMTGICNRRCFFTMMPTTLKKKFPISLMMIDVDNFKRINDTYGHSSGDEVLKQLADILKNNTRSTDIVARLGGEEFAVVLPQTTCENALKIAEKIKQDIVDKTFIFDLVTDKMTISIGIATTKIPIHTDCFLKNADEALYKAKETRNAIVAYK